MKTNLIASKIRLKPEQLETKDKKQFQNQLIRLLANQAAKVFEGLLIENPELSKVTWKFTGEEIEYQIVVSLTTKQEKLILSKIKNLFLEIEEISSNETEEPFYIRKN